MSYTISITKTIEKEELKRVYMDDEEAKAAGFENSGYVSKAIMVQENKEIYSQTVEEDELDVTDVIKAVIGEK